jgi:hypothetical protein
MTDDKTRIYFLVDPASPVMDAVKAVRLKRKVFDGHMSELQKEFKAKNVWYRGEWILGLEFEGEVPAPFKKKAGEKYCIPDRTSAGRAMKKRLESIRDFSWFQFSSDLSKDDDDCFDAVVGHTWMYASFGNFGDKVILSVPAAAKVIKNNKLPAGLTELKMSEYWAIKEKEKETLG